MRQITVDELAIGRKLWPNDPSVERPATRGDCARVERPCPFVACQHNLYLDVHSNGSIQFNFPDIEPSEMPATGSCALDVAEAGNVQIDRIGALMNLSRGRVLQIEERALRKLPRGTLKRLQEERDTATSSNGERVRLRVVGAAYPAQETDQERTRRLNRHKKLESMGLRVGQRGELVVINRPGDPGGEAA